MNKEAYIQGFNDALASIAIGVAHTQWGATVVVSSKDREGVVTLLASATVQAGKDGFITL